MKRLTPIEKVAFALGLVFIIAGAGVLIHPTVLVVSHPASGRGVSGRSTPDILSKNGSQYYGVFAIGVGAGISFLSFYRGKRK